MTPHNELMALQQALEQLRQGRLDAIAFSDIAGRQSRLAAAVPERFSQALEQLRSRLESSASFSEESCSFSQRDLWDAVQHWIDRAADLPALQRPATSKEPTRG